MIEHKTGKEKFQSLNIYFGRSLGGGRDYERQAEQIAEAAERMGHTITSKDVVYFDRQKALRREAQRTNNPDRFIHEHHADQMMSSDIGVFEISQPSLGVGWESCFISRVLQRPVILLKHKDATSHSATILGDPIPWVLKYEYDGQNYKEILNQALMEAMRVERNITSRLYGFDE